MPALRRKLILDYTRRKLDSPMLGRGFESLRLHLMIKTLLAAARRVFYSDDLLKDGEASFKVRRMNKKPPMRKQRYGFDSLHGSGGKTEGNPRIFQKNKPSSRVQKNRRCESSGAVLIPCTGQVGKPRVIPEYFKKINPHLGFKKTADAKAAVWF